MGYCIFIDKNQKKLKMRNVILTVSLLLGGIFAFAQGGEPQRPDRMANHTTHNSRTNIASYKTFDFELINTDNPAMEKQLTDILQNKLEQKGLKRDRKNPGLLVFISFYSGDDKQYVPPTSKVKTRYGNEYNIWTGGNNRSQISSKLSDGYPKTTYRYSYKVRMLDAQKTKANSPAPPIVWQSEQEGTSGKKIDLLQMAPSIYDQMIRGLRYNANE